MRVLLRLLPLATLMLLSISVAAQEEEIDESKLKVPPDVTGWMSYIDRKWNSTKAEELQTVKVCARNLKAAVAKDESDKRRFLKKFAGYTGITATLAVNAALLAVRLDAKVLRKELERLRAPANTAIENSKYTEKDGGKYQPEVDKVVEPLLQLWREPVAYCAAQFKLDLKTPAPQLDALATMLADIESSTGSWGEGVKDAEAYMKAKATEMFAIKAIDYEKGKSTLDANEKIKSDFFDDESKLHVRSVNDYRMALGRPVVAVHVMLCEACTSHAKWMDANNKIGHDFPGHPDGKTPNDRAAKFGFTGKVSENVTGAKGGEAAVWKFYQAAEHHRNMVRFGHAVVGVGHAGEKWCENFSSSSD